MSDNIGGLRVIRSLVIKDIENVEERVTLISEESTLAKV